LWGCRIDQNTQLKVVNKLPRLKILIAEDEPVSLRLMEASLTIWGYEAVSAKDGAEAQAMLQAGGIHICIIDWEMPKMDGIELCEWIRGNCFSPEPYVVMLTNRKEPEHIQAGYAAGVDTFISKPFDRTSLRSRIAGAATRHPVEIAPLPVSSALSIAARNTN
jgi:DNA-binding response OmpR family regulator